MTTTAPSVTDEFSQITVSVTGEAIGPIFVSVKQAAELLGIKPWACYQLCDEQKIESRYQGRRRLVLVESLRKYAAGLPTTAPTDVAALGVSGGTPAACPAWCELTSPHLDELHAATLGKDAHVQVFLVAPEDGGGPVEVDLYVAGNAVEVVSPFMLTPDELETMSATLRAAAAKLRRLQDRPL